MHRLSSPTGSVVPLAAILFAVLPVWPVVSDDTDPRSRRSPIRESASAAPTQLSSVNAPSTDSTSIGIRMTDEITQWVDFSHRQADSQLPQSGTPSATTNNSHRDDLAPRMIDEQPEIIVSSNSPIALDRAMVIDSRIHQAGYLTESEPQPVQPALFLAAEDPLGQPDLRLVAGEDELSLVPVPLPSRPTLDNVHVKGTGDRISIQAIDAPLDGVLSAIAQQQGLNIVAGDVKDERISVTLRDVELEHAFYAILAAKGFTWSRHGDIIIVSSLSGEKKSAAIQGVEVRVYNLNYITSTDIENVINGLLSPVGQAFTKRTNSGDHRQTHEQLVVEDLPPYLQRIEEYLDQADIAPRQVSVEAHVLQVSLRDNLRHGVDFDSLLRLSNSDVTLESSGFANETGPTTMLRINGRDLNGLIEAIKSTTDAKTLASPKVAVLNGQEARMQVGGQIGYLLTTATQTSTLQSVDFLQVGVILTVTPIITDDNQVLMQVRPEVSTGRINATTQLPESETTEVETKVMLADGEALIIGGLIQEIDNDSQNKLPWLGEIKFLGRLFQKRQRDRERNEIIIALVPRILTNEPYCRELHPDQVDRATTRLFHGALKENDRTIWEPELGDPIFGNKDNMRRDKCASTPFQLGY